LELMSYGLTGLAAAVVLASCFAYGGESLTAHEKRSTVSGDKASLATFSTGWRERRWRYR